MEVAKPPSERDSAPGAPGQLWKVNLAGTFALRLEFPSGVVGWRYLSLSRRKLLLLAGRRGEVAGRVAPAAANGMALGPRRLGRPIGRGVGRTWVAARRARARTGKLM